MKSPLVIYRVGGALGQHLHKCLNIEQVNGLNRKNNDTGHNKQVSTDEISAFKTVETECGGKQTPSEDKKMAGTIRP